MTTRTHKKPIRSRRNLNVWKPTRIDFAVLQKKVEVNYYLTAKEILEKKRARPRERQSPKITYVTPSTRQFSKPKLWSFAAASLLIALAVQSAFYLVDAQQSQKQILGAATSAYSNIDQAQQNLGLQDFAEAGNDFEAAQNNLRLAQQKLDEFKTLTVITPQGKSADKILTGAYKLAEAGKTLASALQLFEILKVNSGRVVI